MLRISNEFKEETMERTANNTEEDMQIEIEKTLNRNEN